MAKRNENFMSDLEEIGVALLEKNAIKEGQKQGLNVISIREMDINNPLFKMLLDHKGIDYKKASTLYEAVVFRFKPGIC